MLAARLEDLLLPAIQSMGSHLPQGYETAPQEFESVDAARAMMESPARHSLSFPDARGSLLLQYAQRPAGRGGGRAHAATDWICDMCQASNFERSAQNVQLAVLQVPLYEFDGFACSGGVTQALNQPRCPMAK